MTLAVLCFADLGQKGCFTHYWPLYMVHDSPVYVICCQSQFVDLGVTDSSVCKSPHEAKTRLTEEW